MKLLLAFLLLVLLSNGVEAQPSLAACPRDPNTMWHNCFGAYRYPTGVTHVGEFQHGMASGIGIRYHAGGSILDSGLWDKGHLVRSFYLDPTRFSRVSTNQVIPISTIDAQTSSTLPSCSNDPAVIRHNCIGKYKSFTGEEYIGEYRNDKSEGKGVYTWPDGSRYIGEFLAHKLHGRGSLIYPGGGKHIGEWRGGIIHGDGIRYSSNGAILQSGSWENGNLVKSFSLDPVRFPFNPSAQIAGLAAEDPAEAERNRLVAEFDAERRKRQELENKLALETRERERLASEARDRRQQNQPMAPPTRAERRVALVIGNSAYSANPIPNAANDASDIDEVLRRSGFHTTLVRNATLSQMREATRRFANQLSESDVALIYYAGHGIESNRKNYMIPVNADLKFEYELSDQAYDVGTWLEMLESIKSSNADRVNIVILDACRNNTLIGARSLGRGLGRMDAPTGTFLAYSTAPGKVAADGAKGDRNSPFTRHLLRAMQQAGLPIEEVFKEVRRNVSKETNGSQVPWESTSLTGFFAFVRPQ